MTVVMDFLCSEWGGGWWTRKTLSWAEENTEFQEFWLLQKEKPFLCFLFSDNFSIKAIH